MSIPAPVTPLAIEDYEAIEAAVMETQRGRWFLTEYARRNRNADTDAVLGALERIERTIRRERAVPDIDRIRLDLADMAEAISRTKQEIAQMKLETEHGGRFSDASHELDAIVEQTETATNDILLAAEGIQESAWTLREAGAADELCDKLDTHATDIYTACSFQDLTGQRTRKVVTVLRYLESRIGAMIDIWGLGEEDVAEKAAPGTYPADARPDAHLLNGPQLHGRGIDQTDVDELMWHEAADEDAANVEENTAETALAEDAADVFDAVPAARADTLFEDVDLAEADVFAPEDVDRVTADARAREDDAANAETAPAAEAPLAPATVVVGNTALAIAPRAVAEPAASPQLAVVPAADPVADLDPNARLLTFG